MHRLGGVKDEGHGCDSCWKCSPRSIMGRFMETLWDLKPENEGGNCFNLFRRCHRWEGWFLWWGTLIVTGASLSHSWSDAPIFAFSQCWGFHNFVWWSFSPYLEVSSHTMVFTMLQCSNTKWTRLLELGFISKICLDEWNSLSLMMENLYPCSFNCLSSAAIITLKLSGSKSSQFLSFTSA